MQIEVKCLIEGIGGTGIAQTKKFIWGKIPLSTIKNDIVYGQAQAKTTRGTIGVTVKLNFGVKKRYFN